MRAENRVRVPTAMGAGGWLLLGLVLRVWQLGWFPLREDEALYGYWARLIASGRDVMLERVAVDKPPFFLYALARWFEWFGATDLAGRSFNIMISFLTMILVWRLAHRVYGAAGGLWSLAFFALSPFAISFAATMYMDPMLTAWIVLALWLASWRLGFLAGLALGMGFATKQNALLFIPLVLLALPLGQWPRWWPRAWAWQGWSGVLWNSAGFALGWGYVWHKVWQWNNWRILPASIPDFWTQSWHSYGGLHGVSPLAWPHRLEAGGEVWRGWGGSLVGTGVLLGLMLLATLEAWRQVRARAGADAPHPARWTLLLMGYSLAYLALHVVWSFQTWDRYLLPLAPLSAMVAAQGGLLLWHRLRSRASFPRWGVAVLLALMLVGGATRAAWARIPVGGDHGAYTGLLSVARYLQTHVPSYHGVIYQRWLGWQWNWYLWDREDRVYWADAAMLAEDAARDPYGYARFVVFPAWHLAEKEALEAALAPLGLHLEERLRVRDGTTGEVRFLVYELEPHVRLFRK